MKTILIVFFVFGLICSSFGIKSKLTPKTGNGLESQMKIRMNPDGMVQVCQCYPKRPKNTKIKGKGEFYIFIWCIQISISCLISIFNILYIDFMRNLSPECSISTLCGENLAFDEAQIVHEERIEILLHVDLEFWYKLLNLDLPLFLPWISNSILCILDLKFGTQIL